MKKTTLPIQREEKREKDLYAAIFALESVGEVDLFLEDLCTPAELRAIADRWQVAKLIHQDVPYRKIQELTGVSTATITRVARALAQGRGGYALALGKAKNQQKKGDIRA